MLTSNFLASKLKNCLIKACNWFAADLQILVMCRLKLSLSSIWTPNNFTKGEASITLSPISRDSFVWSLSIIIYWNLPRLTIILFVSNQSMAMTLSNAKTDIEVSTFLAKVVNVLSSAKLLMHISILNKVVKIIKETIEKNEFHERALRYTRNNLVTFN